MLRAVSDLHNAQCILCGISYALTRLLINNTPPHPQTTTEGESDMYFSCENINLQGISPSALTNSGLLIASFMADGAEVAAVNCVVNVTKNTRGEFMREILNPLG